MCVCVSECVCVCVWFGGCGWVCMYVYMCVSVCDSVWVYVCVCVHVCGGLVWVGGRERHCVCGGGRERECVCVCICLCACVCVLDMQYNVTKINTAYNKEATVYRGWQYQRTNRANWVSNLKISKQLQRTFNIHTINNNTQTKAHVVHVLPCT